VINAKVTESMVCYRNSSSTLSHTVTHHDDLLTVDSIRENRRIVYKRQRTSRIAANTVALGLCVAAGYRGQAGWTDRQTTEARGAVHSRIKMLLQHNIAKHALSQ